MLVRSSQLLLFCRYTRIFRGCGSSSSSFCEKSPLASELIGLIPVRSKKFMWVISGTSNLRIAIDSSFLTCNCYVWISRTKNTYIEQGGIEDISQKWFLCDIVARLRPHTEEQLKFTSIPTQIMGGQRQIRPGKVYQSVTALMNHRIYPDVKVQQPIWYNVVESIPPSEILTRPYPPQHIKHNPKVRKASRLFQPQQLVYEEDELRTQFYKDHPWELARPRMIIEMDGKDAQKYDWSKGLRQPGMPLCGEW